MKGWRIKGLKIRITETTFLLVALLFMGITSYKISDANRSEAARENYFEEKTVSESVSFSKVKSVAHTVVENVESQSNNENNEHHVDDSGVYAIPYEIGLFTRDNMMTAAMSLVGDVRYVWGGGHSGAAYIKGINPVWKQFDELYPSEPVTKNGSSQADVEMNEGFGTCIKPSGSWCPIHGYVHTAFHGGSVYSIDQYIDQRAGLFDKIDLTNEKYREMLSTVNYSHGVNAHVIDGLDCSGYVSWLFNQVQENYKVNTAARYFIQQDCFNALNIGDDLLPGDIFAWETHIVVIVGRIKDGSKAYVTLEETPNVLRFGVAYYIDADQSDVNYGKRIAAEANSLIGGLNPKYERPHVYCINTVGSPVSANNVSVNSVAVADMTYQSDEASRAKVMLTAEAGALGAEGGYSQAYDTLRDGAAYKLVYVYMPRGYHGTAQDLGAPNEGEYEFSEIEEKEEGFYGRYYVRLSDVADGKAGHSADEKIDGFKVRHVFMPRDFAGNMSDLDIPSDEEIDHRQVLERSEGFYATYYIGKKAPQKEDTADEGEVSDVNEDADEYEDDDLDEEYYNEAIVSENRILRVARFIEPFDDEGIPLPDTGVPMEEMDAVEIIRHTLNNLPLSKINGYESYDGEIFADFVKKEQE